jgi:Fe-S-cluster-containing hydrogenase component 2
MARGKKKSGITDRREFLADTGAALTFGVVTGLTAYARPVAAEPAEIPVAARIEHNPSLCAGCGVCGLMCSLYHEKETKVALSRAELVREPFEGDFSLNVCRQCQAPSCYQSCPLKDSALCIDKATGIKYINAGKCDGCGKCTQACPLKPARVRIDPARKVAFKCDLCRDRKTGPICVEYCSQKALAIVPGNKGV